MSRVFPSSKPIYKIALLGDGAVGKTALRDRFMKKTFTAEYVMTIGADFATKTVEIGGKEVLFQIWDLAGQPRFESVRELYYKGSLGALLVFDVTRQFSFENTPIWIQELWKNNGKGKVPIVLLGNKIDLRNQVPNPIETRYGKILSRELSRITSKEGFGIPYIETSAKTGENVDQAFYTLGEAITAYIARKIEKIGS
ncbi:MAG: GTP-binding protein [Candidatus Hodarchaeota archaeon]